MDRLEIGQRLGTDLRLDDQLCVTGKQRTLRFMIGFQTVGITVADTDNTAAANATLIDNICQTVGVPVIAGEEGICAGCGVATLSISYYDLGVTTGKMAAKILKGEADISTMKIEYAPATKKYNKEMCEYLGITVPDDYTEIN